MGVRVPPFASYQGRDMKVLILLFICLSSSLSAIPQGAGRFVTSVDKGASSFEMRKKMRVDVFDFSGGYPNLENIDIDAKRKKRVEFTLTGEYPILETIQYDGSFGILTGKLTGNFPKLRSVNFLCGSCAINLDLSSDWKQSCEINVRGAKENVILKLPKSVGLIVHTKTGVNGKVIPAEGFKKQGWFGVLNKTYHNPLVETAEIVLTLNIETTDGNIILE